jgi:glycosyltransferase involved in cell wall biosynthesis
VRVLYISDSLGTPIHPRGIFNFSVSLVEILKTLGATIDLVVEGADGFGLEGRFGALSNSAPDAVNAVRLSEIHRYFAEARFSFRWNYKSAHVRLLAKRGRSLINAWLEWRDQFGYRPNIVVDNAPGQIDFTPRKNEHLNLFDSLVLKRGFYSASMSRANLGFSPIAMDASGYDLAVVDTPHFIEVRGIAPARILTVVHDLIPLRDPTMDANWRNLFMRKLEATLALNANMVFVSQYTQQAFKAAFPRHVAPGQFVFHPAIRKQIASGAEQGLFETAQPPVFEEPTKSAEPPAFFESASAHTHRKIAPTSRKKARASYGGQAPPPGWDAALPFFVTATSDEPRKNIALAVRAFYDHLRGQANLVVLGEVDSQRYDPGANSNVHFPGYVADAEKVQYFSNAGGVLFASLSEGFGIPIVEGAVLEMPVLCSDIEVFREVAEEHAFYFDPRDGLSLARVVIQVLARPEEARRRAAALRSAVLARFSQEAVGVSVRAALTELGAL